MIRRMNWESFVEIGSLINPLECHDGFDYGLTDSQTHSLTDTNWQSENKEFADRSANSKTKGTQLILQLFILMEHSTT